MSKELLLEGENIKPYKIVIENNNKGLVDNLKNIKPADTKICIISDSNVAPIHGETIMMELLSFYDSVSLYTIEAGEENKNLDTVSDIYANLISLNFNRNDMLVALGGGVVGDITGFAASTYMRGIDFIQIPTTLLAQVDSSVGGKTGVDYNAYKNMVGAFYHPRLVYINTEMLKTLPIEQFSAGMAEVIKSALIKNTALYKWLGDNFVKAFELNHDTIEYMVYETCSIKQKVVSNDPTEKGERALLNFGHTLGHAIEKLFEFKLLHGECVSLGIVAAAYISKEKGFINDDEFCGIVMLLKDCKLPISFDNLDNNAIILAAKHDKKSIGNTVKFILLDRIGDAFIDTNVKAEEMISALEFMRSESFLKAFN